jgi:hypothetical protein
MDISKRHIRYKGGVKMQKFISILFVLCLLVNFSFTKPAMALSCAKAAPIKDEFKKSSIVFMGTALNSNIDTPKVNFHVKTIWKGSMNDIQEGVFLSNMWMEVKAGQNYLLYATNRDGQLEVNICGNSQLWSDVNPKQFIEEFGTGQFIEQEETEKEQQNRNLFWLISGVLVLVVGIGVTIRYRCRQE